MGPSELPRPGDVVSGKYRIDSVIGQGGMGVVLGAIDQSLGRPVAIKFLTPARAESVAAATRFDREARAAASIRSEHVVGIYEVGALPGGSPYIVMERLTGSDLSDVVQKRGGLPVDFACDLLLQTCSALADAHARGIVHRDLKPQNLFLTTRADGSPCLKVLDFGISKADSTDSSPKLTSTDMVMGTPLYMSPEQVRSLKSVDARADIWALGAILQELLTASPPFDGPTASALHAAIAMDQPAPVRTKRPDVSPMIEAIILRCLEKDPARRFQSVAELADALAPHATDRGRESARAVVRSAPAVIVPSMPPLAPPPGGFGMASTMDVRSRPSFVATHPNATTAGAWQQVSAPKPASSTPVALIIGLVIGAMALLSLAVAALFLFRASPVQGSVTVATGQPVAIPSVASAAPPPIASSAAPVAVTPSLHPAVKGKDAGAPAAAKDAGAKPVDDDAAARAHAASMQGLCDHHQMMMSPTMDDATRKTNAQSAKIMDCFRMDSVLCERAVCNKACLILDDKDCQRREADVERMSPAKY